VIRKLLAAIGLVLLCGCAQRELPPDGTVLLDEDLTLSRQEGRPDLLTREFAVDENTLLVAQVDEGLVDVKLALTALSAEGKETRTVRVENNLAAAGVELAALDTGDDARVRLTLTSDRDGAQPGSVHLRVRRYSADAAELAGAHLLRGALAWTVATDADSRADTVRKNGLDRMQQAIDELSQSSEAALAAQARLIKAGMYAHFRIDPRESRAEAQRAATAFGALAPPDARSMAQARLLEAQALFQISGNGKAVNPTSAEAIRLARGLLMELGGPASALGTPDRARALITLGQINLDDGNTDDARRLFEEAQAIYQQAGLPGAEFETRCQLARVLLNRGQFREAALAFDVLLPGFERISDPDERAWMYISTARALAYSGRGDEAPEPLQKALEIARANQLRVREANALHGLGNVYQFRGDALQARELYAEAMRISREENDTVGLTGALELNGFIARSDGDYARAIELHREAVELAVGPVPRARALRALGLDYYYAEDYPRAVANFRLGLAEKMQDPSHHAYSDIKRELAEALIVHGDGKPATLDEAGTLVAASLKKSIEVGDKQGEIGGYRVTAQLLAARGRYAEAQQSFERALAVAHEYREKFASSEARAAPLRQEQAAFRDYLDLMLRDLARESAGKPRRALAREERALRILEIAREGNYGATRTGELDSATAARVDQLLGDMAQTSLSIASTTEAGRLQELQLEMAKLYGELDRVRTAAALKRASQEKFRPDTARSWRSLRPGVTQLSYALGNRHAYAWSRSDGGILVARLALSPRELEHELATLAALDAQGAPESIEQSLQRVSATLLPAGLLPAKSSSVEIAAEGRIASVSFPGLLSPTTPGRRLVETHDITMVASLFAVDELQRPAQRRPYRLVALASGHGTLRSAPEAAPKLQAATKEVRAVAAQFQRADSDAAIRLLLGAEGSLQSLKNLWSSGADVVHFATHARADLRQPLASLLMLPARDERGAPTYLTAGQVENWRGDVELVFLSACESAIGPPRFAVGMPGLQRAFLRAGARSVIATLWPIEDLLAQEFSTDFYERYTRGMSAAAALSATQREWLTPAAGMPEPEQLRRRITALAHGLYTP